MKTVAVIQARMNPGSRAEEMPLSFPGFVDAPRDEAVRRAVESGHVVSLFFVGREFLMKVRDVGLEAVQLYGIALESSSHRGADGVDDAGLGNNVVSHVEGVQRAGVSQEWILGMVIGL